MLAYSCSLSNIINTSITNHISYSSYVLLGYLHSIECTHYNV